MGDLPAAVYLALWCAAGRLDGSRPGRPDHPVATWRSLGERRVLVALPAPGRLGLLPLGSRDLRDAALDAGQCVFSPMLGLAAVPDPSAEEPLGRPWTVFDVEPMDTRRVEALDPAEARQELDVAVDRAVEQLTGVDQGTLADLGDAMLARFRPTLPAPGEVPSRLLALMDLAQRVLEVAGLRHDPAIGAMDAYGTSVREMALADLEVAARSALEIACNAAVLQMARG